MAVRAPRELRLRGASRFVLGDCVLDVGMCVSNDDGAERIDEVGFGVSMSLDFRAGLRLFSRRRGASPQRRSDGVFSFGIRHLTLHSMSAGRWI